MDYPGLELENFDKAVIWRKYIYLLIKKYINNNVLEVGAGTGSFTKNYEKENFDLSIKAVKDLLAKSKEIDPKLSN